MWLLPQRCTRSVALRGEGRSCRVAQELETAGGVPSLEVWGGGLRSGMGERGAVENREGPQRSRVFLLILPVWP